MLHTFPTYGIFPSFSFGYSALFKICLLPLKKDVFLCSKSFIVQPFIFRSVSHLELIFVHGVRQGSGHFIFISLWDQVIRFLLERPLFAPLHLHCCPCHKPDDRHCTKSRSVPFFPPSPVPHCVSDSSCVVGLALWFFRAVWALHGLLH